jgi:Reverse transcriptase (RNA-dependent DNA polymerase)
MCWSIFLHFKSELARQALNFIQQLQNQHNLTIKYIRLDNSGENKSLEHLCKATTLQIQFEYTSPGTPQYNGRVERKFATLYGKIRSVLNSTETPEDIRKGLWAEAANWVTHIENCVVTSTKTVPSYVQFYGKPPNISIHQFGEIGIVANTQQKIKGKLTNRGIACMNLGLAPNHSIDVYRMLNLHTKRVLMSRDITWLNQTYGQWKNLSVDQISRFNNYDSDNDPSDTESTTTTTDSDPNDLNEFAPTDEDNINDQNDNNVFPNETTEPTLQLTTLDPNDAHQPMNPKLTSEMKRLQGFFNPIATARLTRSTHNSSVTHPGRDAVPSTAWMSDKNIGTRQAETTTQTENTGTATNLVPSVNENSTANTTGTLQNTNSSNILLDSSNVEFSFLGFTPAINESQYKDIYDVPSSYDAAWDHKDIFQQTKWREAIKKELDKMEKLNVWEIVNRKTIPTGRRCVKHKWVFDIKRNGTFRARLVACGYSQVPGIDFTEVFSPVVNEPIFRIILLAQILWGLKANLIDVETAFLHGELEEEIYMDCPKGLTHKNDECLRLKKALYGLVQSARQFYKKFTKILKDIGFEQSYAEPCLFHANKCGRLLLILHVDDCYVVGSDEGLQFTKKSLEKMGLKLKVEENVTDYLSCQILFNKDKTMAWLGQPHLFKKMEKSYGHLITRNSNYKTPGTPNLNIIRPTSESEKVSSEDQKIYRSAIGSLLQLIKYSRPDISNVVRELAKCMDGATPAAFKEMQRLMKFVFDTRNFGLMIKPKLDENDKWHMKMYTDSDWAGDKENRRSVTGYIMFLCGVPIIWKSKLQKTVSLSSTEAEYYALSEAAKEVKFIIQVLLSVNIQVKLPVIVHVDNVGAIFMSENVTATSRTKHIDARYHFIREYIEDGYIKIIFVKTDDNHADIFTKNVTGDIYDKHVQNYLVQKSQIHEK